MLSRLLKPAAELGSIDLALRLTLLQLLLRPMGFWAIRASLLLIAALGLLVPRILRAPLTWLCITAAIAWQLIDAWPLPDNHIYLLCYWCLAIFLALISADVQRILKTNSRLLLGLTFSFAVLWKAFLSPEYLDGRFFRITLLQDERFAHTAMLFGGLTESQLRQNREYLSPLPQGAELLDAPELVEPPELRRLAILFTWGGLFMEAVLALVMLIPLPLGVEYLRHLILLVFCIVTYAFAPVAGFGWLLLVMGLGQCDERYHRLRTAYVVTYLLVLLYSEVPWTGLLYRMRGTSERVTYFAAGLVSSFP
jgi:hypothetical protein